MLQRDVVKRSIEQMVEKLAKLGLTGAYSEQHADGINIYTKDC